MCFVDTKPRKRKARAVKPSHRAVHYKDPSNLSPTHYAVEEASCGTKTTTVAEAAMLGYRTSIFTSSTAPLNPRRRTLHQQDFIRWDNALQSTTNGGVYPQWQDDQGRVVCSSIPAYNDEKMPTTPRIHGRRPSSLIRDVEGVRKLASRLEKAIRPSASGAAPESASPATSCRESDSVAVTAGANAERALLIAEELARQRELDLAKKQGRDEAERELIRKHSGGVANIFGERKTLDRYGHSRDHCHRSDTPTRSPSPIHDYCHHYRCNDKVQEAYPRSLQDLHCARHIYQSPSQPRQGSNSVGNQAPTTEIRYHLLNPSRIRDLGSAEPAANTATSAITHPERRRSSTTSFVVRKVLERLQLGSSEWTQIAKEKEQAKERAKVKESEARQERQRQNNRQRDLERDLATLKRLEELEQLDLIRLERLGLEMARERERERERERAWEWEWEAELECKQEREMEDEREKEKENEKDRERWWARRERTRRAATLGKGRGDMEIGDEEDREWRL